MARRVYFAFHYQRDIFRVNVVRNSHVVEGVAAAGFSDGSLWEEAKRKGDAAIKALIDKGLEGTSVTAVLIGAQTAHREYVEYEISQSWKRGNGLLGIYIHNINDAVLKRPDVMGQDPFVKVGYTGIQTHDWVLDRGYDNIGKWVEGAYNQERANKPKPMGREALLGALGVPQPKPSLMVGLAALYAQQPKPTPYSSLLATLYGQQQPKPSTLSDLLGAVSDKPKPSPWDALARRLYDKKAP